MHAENQQRINKIQRIEYGKVIGISSVIFSVIPLIFPQFNLTMMTLACIFWATYMVCICFQIKELKQSSKTI
ncbi:putative membrane protein [Collimonas pratensis]|uniref:Membrane protein n=1 Tax=Collimonas pratensis TaxID=279113 RepID=A0ABM5Z480_9BURK|nr:putative membrane protein [Collimonas pratensis]